jgi:hypothetical protein
MDRTLVLLADLCATVKERAVQIARDDLIISHNGLSFRLQNHSFLFYHRTKDKSIVFFIMFFALVAIANQRKTCYNKHNEHMGGLLVCDPIFVTF